MIVAIWVAVVAIVGLFFKTEIVNVVSGLKDGAELTWYGFIDNVWPAIKKRLYWFSGIVFLVAGIIGFCTHAFWSAIIISIAFPIWFVSLVLISLLDCENEKVNSEEEAIKQSFPVKRLLPVFKMIKNGALITLLFSGTLLFIGLWSPEVKESFDEWRQSKKQALANLFQKETSKSEASIGVMGKLAENSWVYDRQKNPLDTYDAGTPFLVIDGKGKSAEKGEGMIKVMLVDPEGNFVRGNIVYVPKRKIAWS